MDAINLTPELAAALGIKVPPPKSVGLVVTLMNDGHVSVEMVTPMTFRCAAHSLEEAADMAKKMIVEALTPPPVEPIVYETAGGKGPRKDN